MVGGGLTTPPAVKFEYPTNVKSYDVAVQHPQSGRVERVESTAKAGIAGIENLPPSGSVNVNPNDADAYNAQSQATSFNDALNHGNVENGLDHSDRHPLQGDDSISLN
jgi:hypothetical protein